MATQDQQLTKKLAEMKSFLEKRIKQQEDEVHSLRSYLEAVDTLLAERSFRPVEIPAATEQPAKPKTPAAAAADRIPVTTTDGRTIASMLIDQDAMHIVPKADLKLDSNSPPLRAFLLGKVLDPMQTKDRDAASAGTLSPDSILSYELEQEDGYLKAIHIRNYGDDRRLLELKNAIRWTLRRMYEKISPKK